MDNPGPDRSAALLPLILVGGGGHCQACIDVLEAAGGYAIQAIADRPEQLGKQVSGYPIRYTDADLPALLAQCPHALICLGQIKSSEPRRVLYERITALGGVCVSPVSPLAHVSPRAAFGPGTLVMHQAMLNAGVQIGLCGIINSRALLEHGVRVGDFCHISTGAIVNGDCQVGSGVFVGSGAVIIQGVSIGDNAVIGAGSLVLRDVPAGQTVCGIWK